MSVERTRAMCVCGIKFNPPELRFWGVEGTTDALAEVNVVVERKVYGVADSEEKNLHARY